VLKLFGHNAFVYVQLLGGTSKSTLAARASVFYVPVALMLLRLLGERAVSNFE
jgi:hypothetical protein